MEVFPKHSESWKFIKMTSEWLTSLNCEEQWKVFMEKIELMSHMSPVSWSFALFGYFKSQLQLVCLLYKDLLREQNEYEQ